MFRLRFLTKLTTTISLSAPLYIRPTSSNLSNSSADMLARCLSFRSFLSLFRFSFSSLSDTTPVPAFFMKLNIFIVVYLEQRSRRMVIYKLSYWKSGCAFIGVYRETYINTERSSNRTNKPELNGVSLICNFILIISRLFDAFFISFQHNDIAPDSSSCERSWILLINQQ